MKSVIHYSKQLRDLRAIFVSSGFELWFVGGCVRDAMLGHTPKDIDLASSATPDEMIAIFNANNVRFIPTGLQHGTVTAVLDEPYEITSLRTETDHDGRHATVAYTRNLEDDLSRRDLTVNAMAMDFDGKIIDPFGGRQDLKNQRIRFVGNAEERMREDYLRILRYFRFYGRLGGGALDPSAVKAIRATRGGLAQISAERVWMEMSKIITGPNPDVVVRRMNDLALFEIIGMPMGYIPALRHAKDRGVTDPASVMGWYVTETRSIDAIARDWKWSSEERGRAKFIAENGATNDEQRFKEMLVEGVPLDWVIDLMKLNDINPSSLSTWAVPKMPVSGGDLIAQGIKPGPQMGAILNTMADLWKKSGFVSTKAELLATIGAASGV